MFPAVLILLYAAIPLFSDRNMSHWDVFGYGFRHSYSPIDAYWLAAFGGAAVASAAWSVFIFAILYFLANQSERLLSPPAKESVRALRVAILLFAVFGLLPLGCVLLFAADKHS